MRRWHCAVSVAGRSGSVHFHGANSKGNADRPYASTLLSIALEGTAVSTIRAHGRLTIARHLIISEFATWVIDRMRDDLRDQRYDEALLLAASDIHDILSGKVEKVRAQNRNTEIVV
jgi:hypothetical protein